MNTDSKLSPPSAVAAGDQVSLAMARATATFTATKGRAKLKPAELRRALRDPMQVTALLGLREGARSQPGGVMVRCPAHAEATASCSIRAGANGTLHFRCFGCFAKGDVLTLIALVKGLDVRADFPEVLRLATQMTAQIDPSDPNGQECELAPPSCTDAEFEKLAELILTECPLASNVAAEAYLAARHVVDQARRDGWGALSSDAHAQDDLIEAIIACIGPDAWRRSGMARLSLGFSWSDHVLAIPWVDERGRVIALQRRMIGPVGPGTPPYVFSNGRRATAPYGIDSLVNVSLSAPVAFVEGAMDVLSMRALCAKRGVQRAVLGLPGVSAWKPEWARLATGRDALVCVDADPAGERVVSMIAADLRAAGATRVVRMRPLTGKDWNDALMMEAP